MGNPVRVRYAPSPTGEPHAGNIRTALFEWLFARHYGGQFIIRIEDTDQERLVPDSVGAILGALEWLGLDWDEGPTSDGKSDVGPHGPYVQSQRLSYYHQAVQELLEKGLAYVCYCSTARLEALRRVQQDQGGSHKGYDRHCRSLLEEERRQSDDLGLPKVVRFAMPDEGSTLLMDLVRGKVEWSNELLDDFVLLKSDGFPTYHLASVVDDHFMEISHVLRAEEWLSSTPRHLQLYHAFGWEPPEFAHLPILLGPDRSKLSKRHGATSVITYRESGYLPEALLNFLALLGWSLDDKTEFFSKDELIRYFSIERITKAGAVFNPEKLAWFNGQYIRSLSQEALSQCVLPFLERPAANGGLADDINRPLDVEYLTNIVVLIRERLKTLADSSALVGFFFEETLQHDLELLVDSETNSESTVIALRAVLESLEGIHSWDAKALESVIRPLAEELGLSTGFLFRMVRVAVTGRVAAPPLFETMAVLGSGRCLTRMQAAADLLQTHR